MQFALHCRCLRKQSLLSYNSLNSNNSSKCKVTKFHGLVGFVSLGTVARVRLDWSNREDFTKYSASQAAVVEAGTPVKAAYDVDAEHRQSLVRARRRCSDTHNACFFVSNFWYRGPVLL
jgi:hypothetical protein